MERLEAANRSKKTLWALAAVIFLFALALNFLTPYVADDYVYRLGFHTKKELTGVLDVAKSMYVHSYRMNGRVVSHFFGQLFMLWPKAIFNIVNSAVITALLFLMSYLASGCRRPTAFTVLCAAMAFWVGCPVFGQVALWQLGSVNYLWGLFFGIIFILPYFFRFFHEKDPLDRTWKRILFSIFSFFFGFYVEIMSFIAPFIAAVLVISYYFKKKTLKTWLIVPIILSAAGYLALMSMPAELAAKQTSMSITILLKNFVKATEMLKTYGFTLIIVWIALEVLGFYLKGDRERLLLSAVFAFSAVLANYMLTFAAYYEPRCACPAVMLLIMACLTAGEGLSGEKLGKMVKNMLFFSLSLTFFFSAVTGCAGIFSDYSAYLAREEQIIDAKQAGETDLTLPVVHPTSPYSAFWGLLDLNTDTRDTWPNIQMSEYYGVDSIIGY